MVDAVKTPAADTSTDESQVDGNEAAGEEEQIDWQARATQAEKALNKEKAIRKQAQEAAKNAKKGISEDGQDYKKLYEQADAKAAKVIERAKRADITAAATAQLTKIGVTQDGMGAALKLMDINGVEWDEEDGVDATSVKAAVTTLRNEYPFLFEKKVASTSVKVAKDGSTGGNDKEISRSEFDKLSARDQGQRISSGFKVVE
jgi:hypothetical protein